MYTKTNRLFQHTSYFTQSVSKLKLCVKGQSSKICNMRRGPRGRGIRKNPPGRPPQKDTAAARAHSITFPVTARDDEMVQCSECGVSVTFHEFRIHNIEAHYNIAKTMDDDVTLDHKYFVRKLQEMAKYTKIFNFFCPRKPCQSTYKSALGLAFHLETCGKSVEEIAASLLECEVCHKKFSLPNLKWHKRHSHPQPVPANLLGVDPVYEEVQSRESPKKRRSAMKAMEFMRELSDVTVKTDIDDDEGGYPGSRTDAMDEDFALTAYHMKREIEDEEEDQEEDGDLEVTPSIDFILGAEEIKLEPRISATKRQSTAAAGRPDFAMYASKYLEAHPEPDTGDPWDTPLRVTRDPFSKVLPKINTLQPIEPLKIRQYLPLQEKSILLETSTRQEKENPDFHRLNWFEGEVTDSNEGDFLCFTGGPITAMAWHPSEMYLAISTLREMMETPNLMESGSRASSIQIYSQVLAESSSPVFSLRLILGLDFGCVNDLRWSTFWPPLDDSDYDGRYDNRMGYLCAACEDSTCRIFVFRQSDFSLSPTFASQLNTAQNVPVYKKVPEMTLRFDEFETLETGQCTRFDWDEGNRYVVAGYANGHIGVFDLYSTSSLLRNDVTDPEDENFFMAFLNPMWHIPAHFSPVTAINIDPKTPRYFYTGSMDRTIRAWDLELRQEMECKKVGGIIDMCWVRGWIHLGVSVDAAVSNPGSQYNFLRYYPVGSSQGRPNTVEYFNIISTSFFEGMTLSGSENGRVTVSYYDSFWRECDYDRNKKKRNVINIGKLKINENFEPVPFAKKDEDITPFPEGEEPQVTFVFCRDRSQGSQEVEPSRQEVENVYRFYRFTRVNKVCWSPKGTYITIGYRNGIFAILPADFDKLFS